MNRQLISSGTQFEISYGYSRAVKVGNIIAVSGTTAIDEEGNIIGENDYQAHIRYEKASRGDDKRKLFTEG